MHDDYLKHGYVLAPHFFDQRELAEIELILRQFHENWLAANRAFYETGAINSAYITHKKQISREARHTLFSFIANEKLIAFANALIPGGPAFMNTQLFFDPVQADQKNYWHRDIQYVPLLLEEQQKRYGTSNVLHFRIPLACERGIELIPGTHKRWDNAQELDTRLKQHGRQPSDDLPDSKAIPLDRGDLLVFNANMIHRGLYGGNRFALDIIFCDADPELLRFVEPDCLPDMPELALLEWPEVFQATRKALNI